MYKITIKGTQAHITRHEKTIEVFGRKEAHSRFFEYCDALNIDYDPDYYTGEEDFIQSDGIGHDYTITLEKVDK